MAEPHEKPLSDAAVRETQDAAEQAEEQVEEQVLDAERRRMFKTPGFARMRLDWEGDDRAVVQRAQSSVEGRINRLFADALGLMYDLYDVVRTPEATEDGERKVDHLGLTVWKRKPSGDFEEDWTRLTQRQKEDFLFRITTRLFDWEQRAADLWMDSMFAKAQWEESFAYAYDRPLAGTIDDRRAKGNIDSAEERYFAIYQSALSRRADAIVRTMGLLGQRLKDTLGQ